MFKQKTILTPNIQPYTPEPVVSSGIDIDVIPDRIISPENTEPPKEEPIQKIECSHNLCGPLQDPIKQCEKYFVLSKLFSELDSEQKKLIARKNLGIDSLISAINWGSIEGNIEDQADLYNYILNIILSNTSNSSYTIQKIKNVSDDTVREQFILVDDQGLQLGEPINIYKDSAPKNLKLVGQTLTLTYTKANGSEGVLNVDMSKLLSKSNFTDGLDVVDGKVSVNIGEDNELGKNFLDMETNDSGNKALAVRSIDTDSTVTTDRILVAGGPLDSTALRSILPKDESGNAYIEAGTDVQQILLNLFTKVEWPSPTVTEGTINTTIEAPYFTLKNGTTDASGKTYEVGTALTLSNVTLPTVTNTTTARTCQEFTYGYSDTVTGVINKETIISIDATNVTVNGDNYTMTRDFTTFTNTDDSATPSTVASKVTLSSTTCTLKEGECKVTVTITGPKGECTFAEMPSYFIASNVGTLTDEHKSPTKAGATVKEDTTPLNSKEIKVNGRYRYYVGYSTNTVYSQFDSAAIKALSAKKDWITVNGTTTILGNSTLKSNGTSIVVACPAKYKLATITNGVGADILANFSSKGKVSYINGSITTEYMVYIYPITNGAEVEFKNLTLTKA